jgi:hypothetical protein
VCLQNIISVLHFILHAVRVPSNHNSHLFRTQNCLQLESSLEGNIDP